MTMINRTPAARREVERVRAEQTEALRTYFRAPGVWRAEQNRLVSMLGQAIMAEDELAARHARNRLVVHALYRPLGEC